MSNCSFVYHFMLYRHMTFCYAMRRRNAEGGAAMDVRVLRYFLAVAQEESFSRAAQALYLSQPTLSRQIRDLEKELGVALFVRASHNVRLTREGMRLRQRAQEIVGLMDRTQSEFSSAPHALSGEVCIGSGETHLMRQIARVAIDLRREHPGIRYHLFSGNADDVTERLDKGLLDFGLLIEPADVRRYDLLRMPGWDTWGLLLPRTHPLASRDSIRPEDLDGQPLILSRQSRTTASLAEWAGRRSDRLYVAATYNLVYNAAVMVEQGMGIALCLDHLVDTQEHSGLCFRPLCPQQRVGLSLVWKKNQLLSPAADAFLRKVREAFARP